MKKCSICKTKKSLLEFSPMWSGKLGVHSQCKKCRSNRNKKKAKEWAKSHPSRAADLKRRFKEKHRKRINTEKNLRYEIASLREKLALAVEALEFYADKEGYDCKSFPIGSPEEPDVDYEVAIMEDEGRRAMVALGKIR